MGPGTDNSAVKLGDRVGIKWMAGICEACEACRAGVDASCFNGVSFVFIHSTAYSTLDLIYIGFQSHAYHSSLSLLSPKHHEMLTQKLESIRLLHPRHIPTIRPLPRKLRHPHPRFPRLRSRRAPAMCRRNRLLGAPQNKRRVRRLGRHLGSRRRPRPSRRTILSQRHWPSRHWNRPLQQERPRHGKRRRAFHRRGWRTGFG
jgi:hypothetical protein